MARAVTKTAQRLAQLGLHTAEDLLLYFPYRYDDFSRIVLIKDLTPGAVSTIEGVLEMIANRRTPRKRKIITEAIIRDDTGSIRAIWFNQPFLTKNLLPGDRIRIAGKLDDTLYGIQFTSPSYEKILNREAIHTGRLVPIYALAAGLTQKQLRALIQRALPLAATLPEIIPERIRKKHCLMDRAPAIRTLHFPENHELLERARHRIAFEELFIVNLRTRWIRQKLAQSKTIAIPFAKEAVKRFTAQLPFTLTTAQRKASWEIIKDLQKTHPMNRLLNGEVGAGKTAVAAIAARNVIAHGMRAVLLAPTEILARQHARTFADLCRSEKISIALLTRAHHALFEKGQETPVTKKILKTALTKGEADLIIGTHALLQEDVRIPSLAFVIIDEQHRFGVHQRAALAEQRDGELIPHLLSMTATPIPRSLALTIYGDLDVSLLDEMPAGRLPPKTWVVDPEKRLRAYEYLKKQFDQGRQGFVICPLIDPSDKLGVKSATQEFERLARDVFVRYRLGLVHGKLKTHEKQEVMDRFVAGDLDLLIATSVVEVGINVPNSTLMIIEDADRFGLAQLHQFRGRIARGMVRGECFVFTNATEGPSLERLRTFARITDGFKLAERDLKTRGPGTILGTLQSGFPEFKIATLDDVHLTKSARDAANEILPTLATHPELTAHLERFDLIHLE